MARYDLGVPENEVGRLNLLEYDALMKRKRQDDNRQRYNAGIVAAQIWNCAPFGDDKRPAHSPLDYVPDWAHLAEAQRNGDLTKMTPQQQQAYMISMFAKANRR